MDWQPIETAPKDGTVVQLRRVYKGRTVSEGEGLFGELHAASPSRSGPGLDPLGRLAAADYAREDAARKAFVTTPKWLRADCMYLFPEPTHWRPRQD